MVVLDPCRDVLLFLAVEFDGRVLLVRAVVDAQIDVRSPRRIARATGKPRAHVRRAEDGAL